MAQTRHELEGSLQRLSRDHAGQPEASVLEALRNDSELGEWGWTDVRLSTWARQIAAGQPAVYTPAVATLD
jgi:hypothetical protein